MTLLFIILIISLILITKKHNNQICGAKKPQNLTDCNFDSYEDQACCLINYNNTNTGCLFVPQNSTFITPYINLIDFGLSSLFYININCGKNEEINRLCGESPKNLESCIVNNNSTHDCCLFQTPEKNFCLWNDKQFRKNSQIFGTNITCVYELTGENLVYRNKTVIYLISILFFILIL